MTLKIEDLDEFEGLTADMVRAWLRKEGWREEPRGGWVSPGRKIKGGLQVICMADVITPTDGIPEMLTAIQHYTNRSPQSLLREINPRMRAGWPTDEERERHAFWFIRVDRGAVIDPPGAVFSQFVYFVESCHVPAMQEMPHIHGMSVVTCWPCDQHGNKTRRGA